MSARALGCEVAVCGEMASQPLMAFALIGLGSAQLSVAPRAVPLVKRIVRGISAAAGRRKRLLRRWHRDNGGRARTRSSRAVCGGVRRRVVPARRVARQLEPLDYRSSSAPERTAGAIFTIHAPRRELRVSDRHLFTSESVTEGHPDKIADAISDAVLDAILADDPAARVACETLVTTGLAVRRRRDHHDDLRRHSRARAQHDRAHRLHRRRRTASTTRPARS